MTKSPLFANTKVIFTQKWVIENQNFVGLNIYFKEQKHNEF